MIIGEALSVNLSSSDMANPSNWLLEWAGGRTTTAGVQVNESKALGISAVFACVRNLAEDEAKLPLPIFETLEDDSRVKRKDHPLYTVLNFEANPEMTSFNARQAITAAALLYGRGYAEIVRDWSGNTRQLIPLHPTRVTPKRDPENNDELYFEIRNRRGAFEKVLRPDEMFELPGFGLNGIVGEMIATVGKESLGLSIAADQFASSFFGNGINVSGIMSHPGTPDKPQRQLIRESINQKHKGSDKSNRIMMVWDGMTFTPTSVDPDKAQAVESRQFQVEEVARWFRMPPAKIGHLLRTKGWNTQEIANIDYLIDSLLAWFIRWEQEISRKLIVPKEKMTVYAEHNADALLRVDAKTRSVVSQTQFRNGLLTIDEWSKRENMVPPGGEVGSARFVMANMTTADKLVAEPKPRPEPETDDNNQFGQNNNRDNAIAAVRPVILDAVTRCLNKEAIATKKAAKKSKGDNSAFMAWMEKFCDDHREMIYDSLCPGICSLEELLSFEWHFDVSHDFANDHLKLLTESMTAAFEKGYINDLCDSWAGNLAEKITDDLISKVVEASG